MSEAEHPLRILIVEDDISVSKLIGLAIPELGIPHTYVNVLSAEEGLELWKEEPFDLLLTDYNLPGMRGTELIATLKLRGVRVPMVLFTAYDSPNLMREARKLGIAAYIAKPFLIEDLLDILRSLIR